MTTLAADKPRTFDYSPHTRLPVVASDVIYMGAALGFSGSSGNVRPLVAGDVFAGFALERCDNSAGLAGAKHVAALRSGFAVLTVSGASADDKGKAVYASDDDTFTLTAGANTYIGRVENFPETGKLTIAFDANGPNFGHVAELTTGSGGTADGVSEAVSIGAALTGTTDGTANGALESVASSGAVADVTGSPGGTANGAWADHSAAVTGVDGTGSNAASKDDVDTRLAGIADNFKEVETFVDNQRAWNGKVANNLAELAAARVTDAATLLSIKNNLTELETQLNLILRMLKGQ